MDKASKTTIVYKLALLGEAAGYSIDEMILMLRNGLSVATLISLIEWRVRFEERIDSASSRSARIM